MKLRLRCKKTTKIFVVSEEKQDNSNLSDIRSAVGELFGDIGNFQFSLNNADVLEDESKTLKDYGVVGGDLIYIVVENTSVADSGSSAGSTPQVSPHVTQSNNSDVLDKTRNQSVSEQQGTSAANYSCEQMDTGTHSGDSGNQSTETGVQSQLPDCDPVDIAVVNRCLQEPVLCRDASETSVPSLLREVFEEASPQDSAEVLSVILHVLMLETGYVTHSQSTCATVLPTAWRQPGCYRFQYTYPGCQDQTCSVTVIPAGKTTIIHGKVSGDHSVTRQCTIKPEDYVREPLRDVSCCYCNLARLSMVFKDSIANPLVSDIRIAAGIEDVYGLLALHQEVKLCILSNLDLRSLLRVSCVNSELYNVSRDPYLWRRLYMRDFGNRRDNSLSQDWRKLYIQEYKSRKERKKMMSRMTLVTPPTWGPPLNPLAGPSNWIPPGPGMIGGDYDLFPNFPGGLPGIPGRTGPRQPIIPRPRYDLIGPNPDHELDINPGMGPLRPPGPRLGGRNNPFGGGAFGPRFF